METWALANQKGGTGKTTTAINLAAALAARGERVLLVDLDPQAHATLGLGATADGARSTAAFFLDGAPIEDCLVPASGGIHLLPAEARLSEFEERAERLLRPERILVEALGELPSRFDWVLLDCPPRVDGVLCANAARSADTVCLVVETGAFALQGALRALRLFVRSSGDGPSAYGPGERIRVLATRYDRTEVLSREFLVALQNRFGEKVLDTVVRRDERLREAAAFGVPVRDLAPDAWGALDHEALAAELSALAGGRPPSGIAAVAASEPRAPSFLPEPDSPVPVS